MQRKLLTPWLTLVFLSASAAAQEEAKPASLKRAQLTFEAVDADHDRALTFEELTKAGLSRRSFMKFDADESQSWSEADFLLYYEHLLRAGGRNVESDLLSEVARIRKRRDPSRANKHISRDRGEVKRTAPAAKKPVEVSEKASQEIAPELTPAASKPAVAPPKSDRARAEYEKQAQEREEARAAMTPPPIESAEESVAEPAAQPKVAPQPAEQGEPAKEASEQPETAKPGSETAKPETADPKASEKRKNLLERAREAQRKKELVKPNTSSGRTQG